MEGQPGPGQRRASGATEPPERRPAERPQGLRVGAVHGVPIFVSPMALVFAALVASLLVGTIGNRLPSATDEHVLALSVIVSVGFVLSLLAHEIGHALTAQGFGLRVRSVTIHGFAGFTEFEPEPPSAGREFLIAFVGPAVNGILAGLCWLGLLAVPDDGSIGTVLFYLGFTNLTLFVFNLAPGLPLDGGRVVVAAVWAIGHDRLRGQRAGAYGGFVVAGALVVWGTLTSSDGFGAFYAYLLAGFLGFGAYQSLRLTKVRERLPGLSAGRLARRTLPVEGAVPLGEALRRAQEVGATAVAVIDRGGMPVKIMNGLSVDAMPQHRRPWTTVDEVSRTIGPGMTLQAELEGEALLSAVQRVPAPEYLVVQHGRPVGVLAMVDLVARIDPAAAARMVSSR
ncbi:peptidase M50 [Frankia sp. CcI49]|uniref:site-2 protease family protein n=1 Tax=unclassified Frankia TaxID=2632575 RepID=UPI0006CA5841|nr:MULTISPECIES: site-2 protease family protein [unclassified Frankia]KPM55879.1 peptidase M50 [Frankia sp. R43]ONH58257.1 peptidase M50 [Frankia sp. CcI49]